MGKEVKVRWYEIGTGYDTVAFVRSKNKKEALKEVVNFYKSKGYDENFLRCLRLTEVYPSSFEVVSTVILKSLIFKTVDIEKEGNVVLVQCL